MIYKFKVFHKYYGIAVFIDAEEASNEILTNSDIKVNDNIYLRLENFNVFLSKQEIEKHLSKAILDLSLKIEGKVHHLPICIRINAIETNPVNFQEEGLYCAMRGWLVEQYNLKVSDISITVDEEKRKFIFQLPE